MTKVFAIFLLFVQTSCSPVISQNASADKNIVIGAEQMALYLPILQGKKIAMVVNHTSTIGKTHLVDSLLAHQINITKIFAPEHGFRGTASAGEHIANGIDAKTKLPLISLYGKNKKPTAEQLADVDMVIFDIQDVGTRFYTYISTMHYVLEACAENKKEFLLLDRPNPNGHLIDGAVLDLKFQSFVGMHPIPVLHGLTVGELALMINGEKWISQKLGADKLHIIPCKNYTHQTAYILPIAPSPNLPNAQAIVLYPSLCFFEGTDISVGRGTDKQFQVIGSPNVKNGNFTFTPQDRDGAVNPPQKSKLCYGLDLTQINAKKQGFTLKYLIDFYKKAKDKSKFFSSPSFFDKLAGNDQLRMQIVAGKTENQIKASWKKDLDTYKTLREKYLLYPD